METRELFQKAFVADIEMFEQNSVTEEEASVISPLQPVREMSESFQQSGTLKAMAIRRCSPEQNHCLCEIMPGSNSPSATPQSKSKRGRRRFSFATTLNEVESAPS